MKVSCSKTALVTGVRTVYKAISQKATNLILSGILVETTADGLRLVAYDLDLGIETFIPVQVEREGSFVFPAKQFADITGKLPHSEVVLDYQESTGSVEVISDRTHFSIKTMPAKNFPELPELIAGKTWSMPETDLRKMIRKTAIATSNDTNRSYLMGVSVEADEKGVAMVATDSFRLAYRSIEAQTGLSSKIVAIVPARMLREVERNLSADGTREVEICITERHSFVKFANTRYITRLLEGQFPDYRKIFPENLSTRITTDTNSFLAAIDRVSVMCKDELSAIKMSYTGGEMDSPGFLTIKAVTPELGEAIEDMPVSLQGNAEMVVSIRAKYLREVLQVLESDDVEIGFNSSRAPVCVKETNNENYLYLVMPING